MKEVLHNLMVDTPSHRYPIYIGSGIFADFALLQAHIGKATADCYLFGWKWQANTKKATRLDYHWDKIKEKYNFRKEVQFYSLKDTGITDMLNAGVPAIKVRDQARHSDLKITEVYTTRNKFADEVVKNIQY